MASSHDAHEARPSRELKRWTFGRIARTLIPSTFGLLLLPGSLLAQQPPDRGFAPLPTAPAIRQPNPMDVMPMPGALPAPSKSSAPASMPDLGLVAMQVPGLPGDLAQGEEAQRYQVQLEPPGPQRLFRLESETDLQRRMMQEARDQTPPDRITFPREPLVSRQRYDPAARNKTWPVMGAIVEPNYLCHGRLLFEQINAERYGWDLGPIHPAVSATAFIFDWLTAPYHIGTAPCRQYECSAGLCLPGDPVPLMIYPPEMSLTGFATQVATVALILAVFP